MCLPCWLADKIEDRQQGRHKTCPYGLRLGCDLRTHIAGDVSQGFA